MEGICTTGTLEEGELVWQVRTRTRILHAKTHRSTAALHMYLVCATHSDSCVHTALYIRALM